MKRTFGIDFKYEFTPFGDNDVIEGIPSHTAKAFIYTDQPDRSQVEAETGALANSTKTWAAGAHSVEFDIEAIADPDPTSDVSEVTYYIAIKFKLETDEDYQIVIRALPIERATGSDSALKVTANDVEKVCKRVFDYFDVQDVIDEIDTQKKLLKASLLGRGYEWATIQEADSLSLAVVYAVLGALFASESEEDGDKYDKLSQRYETNGKSFLEAIQVKYDASQVQGTNVQTTAVRGYARMVR